MSQALAFANAGSLAATLMVCVVIFEAGAAGYGVMPSNEYDGDLAAIVYDYDPFEVM